MKLGRITARVTAWLTLSATIAAGTATAQDLQDNEEIQRLRNKKVERFRGKVTDEGVRKVVVQTAQGDIDIPSHEIVSIRYRREPAEMILARGFMDSERYADAANSFKTVYTAVKDGPNEFLKAYSLFQLFKATVLAAKLGEAKFEDAVELADEFRKAFPRSRHQHAFSEILGDLYLSKGEYEEARKAFAAMRESEAPGAKVRAAAFEGLALRCSGNAKEAIARYDEAIDLALPANEEIKASAQVFKADALLAGAPDARKITEAEKLLRTALPKVPAANRLAKAVGHNALGDLLRVQNKPPKEALLEGYMYVVVLYNQEPRERSRALYAAYQIFNQLGQRNRAEDMARTLREDFADGEWTKKLPPVAAPSP